MSKNNIQEIMSLGKPTTISLDPSFKNEIIRSQMDGLIRDGKRHLASRKKIHLILIKE